MILGLGEHIVLQILVNKLKTRTKLTVIFCFSLKNNLALYYIKC